MSVYFFNETLNTFKIIGVFTIIVGIIFISMGTRQKEGVSSTSI